MSLNGKLALITGAGKGIGRATALAFAAAGASVSVISRTNSDLEALRRESPGIKTFQGDVSDEKSVQAFVEASGSNLTGIDVIVNNAAVLTGKSALSDVSVEDWDRSFAVNVKGPFLLMRHALPGMRERRTGMIINISSGAGRRAAPGWGPYAVSKSALEALTEQAAAEVNGTGVAVVSVDPGGTRTRMRAAAYPEEDPKRLPAPEDVAAFLVSLASRADRSALNGAALSVREWRERPPA